MDEPLAWQNHGGAAAAKRPLLAIKLGGAAITKKSERGTIDSKNLATCAAAIATCECQHEGVVRAAADISSA